MKINCSCGAKIIDSTDYLSYKAYYISDEDYFDIFDTIEYKLLQIKESKETLNVNSLMNYIQSELIGKHKRMMYRCSTCNRIWIDDKDNNLHEYVPAKPENTEISSLFNTLKTTSSRLKTSRCI